MFGIDRLARTKAGIIALLSAVRGQTTVARLEDPDSDRGRVLVVSPHPDDDVIGCGGTMHRYARSGSRVRVVYMTDGGMGNDAFRPDELAGIRREEALSALRVLGIGSEEATFLGFPDASLRCDSSSVGAVLRVLDEYRPRSVYAPFFIDNHPDHMATVRIVAEALGRWEGDADYYGYEVWSPLLPNVLVDISGLMDIKVRAIGEHRSQVGVIDYPSKIRGLNLYRSMGAGSNVEYCEAFFRCPKEKYLSLVRLMEGGGGGKPCLD